MSAFKYEISWGACLDTFAPVIHGRKSYDNLPDAWKKLREMRIENPQKNYDFIRWPAQEGRGMIQGKILVAVRPVNHDKPVAAGKNPSLTAS